MIRKLQHRDEEGSVLIVALAFLSLFGIFIAAILAEVTTNMRLTGTTRERADRLMAADGGLEWGVQQARTQDSACGSAPAEQELTSTLAVDDSTVTVSCKALAGAVASPASQQWSVITTTGLVTTAGASPRITGGDVWAGGPTLTTPATITTSQADVTRGLSDCTAYTLTGLTVGQPDLSSCSTAPAPDVPHTLPVATANHDPVTTSLCGANNWRIWHPGTYTAASPPDFGPYIYMESGVYYLENVNLTFTSGSVVGGAAPSGETSVLNGGCSTINDTTAGAASRATGSGVTIILGGTSTLRVTGGSTFKFELYTRSPATPDGTAGISIATVPASGTSYTPWSGAAPAFTSSPTGVGGRVAVHGLVYARNAPVALTTHITSPLLGGVVASTLTITPGAYGQKAVEASGRRTLLLTSIAAPAAAGEIASVQSAVVKIANDPTRTASVRSWRAQ